MKCYYPIDSAGNRIGFKTPEACVYDASGTSLTTKLAQINSNISAIATRNTIYNYLGDQYISKPYLVIKDMINSNQLATGATSVGFINCGSLWFFIGFATSDKKTGCFHLESYYGAAYDVDILNGSYSYKIPTKTYSSSESF